MKKEFRAVFQLTKTIIFEVNYYTLNKNTNPYFTTAAAQFYRNKRDFSRCGQAQKTLLRGFPPAMQFFKKWDGLHLHNLTINQYEEMRQDLEKLKHCYNFIFEELDENERPYNPFFDFRTLAEWTKQEPKRQLGGVENVQR